MDGTYNVDLDNIKVEKKAGGSSSDTKLIKGIILDKEASPPGMPKRIENANIAGILSPLEIEKTEFSAELESILPNRCRAFFMIIDA